MIDKSAVFVSTRANVKIAGVGKTGDFLSLRTVYRVSVASIAIVFFISILEHVPELQ
jgi:hypothetical protein